MTFTDLVDLAAERMGGAVLWASDDFFAEKESLLKAAPAVWIEDKYTDRGKWMDGWESRRRFGRKEGHDDCLVRLGVPGVVRGVVVDTAFFRGNYPDSCRIEGCVMPGYPTPEALLASSVEWTEVLPEVKLQGNHANLFAVSCPWRFTHLRLHIFPDGGVARLRVHGDAVPDWAAHGALRSDVDLAAAECGGVVVACTDMFFGSRHNLVFPGRGSGMHDGWETRRRRGPGHDHAVVKLGARGTVKRVVVDTSHFKGNSPDRCSLDVGPSADGPWTCVLGETRLQPHTRHTFVDVAAAAPATHARLHIYPDGGVSRLSLWGTVDDDGRAEQGLLRLNVAPPGAARTELLSCCGAAAWADAMVAARPFATPAALHDAAGRAFSALRKDDWLQAFRAHPRIGEKKPGDEVTAKSQAWSDAEQAGAAGPAMATLAAGHRAYEDRFGFIYIVMATGKTAAEMQALQEARMKNAPDVELTVAADEQRKITRLRLQKLLGTA